jgi:sialic acid synthase SpsE
MGTLGEVEAAVHTIDQYLPAGKALDTSLALLHCISAYPTPVEQANLRAIETLQKAFGLLVGYSDHTLGIEACIAAATVGARIIEKHFTLDKTRTTFRDHALSADPVELQRLATFLHAFDNMLGDGEKRPMPCEQQSVAAARRGAVTVRDVPVGTPLSLDALDFVRPRTGLPPVQALALIGRRVRVPLKQHDFVLEGHIQD